MGYRATMWLVAALCGQMGAAADSARRPNVVLILTDDHHFQGYAVAGNRALHTPNVDALAKRGMLFRQALIACPQCVPSRGALLTGQFPHQNGLLDNANRIAGNRFREPRAIEQLRRAGYQTALIGKWHVRPRPWDCGFTDVRLWLPGGSSRYENPPLASGRDAQTVERRGQITELFTDDAVAFLSQDHPQPFFLWLAYNAPHSPLQADAPYRALYEGKTAADLTPPAHAPSTRKSPFDWPLYAAAISQLDAGIGRVLRALDERGMRQNTLVVVLGDNGWMAGAHGHTGKVLPFEDSIRVPLVISGPGVRAGSVSDALASSIDLTPTWLDLAGVRKPDSMPGRSLRSLLAGTDEWRQDVMVEMAGDFAAFGPVDPYRLVRTDRFKFVVHRSGQVRLYDLQQDPHEETNLAGTPRAAAVEADLRERLARWLKATGDDPERWAGAGARPEKAKASIQPPTSNRN